jgi:hypothetical protein
VQALRAAWLSASMPAQLIKMPTTEAMVKECILALKDRTGSSRQAIKKWILGTYKKVRCSAVFRRN